LIHSDALLINAVNADLIYEDRPSISYPHQLKIKPKLNIAIFR